MCYVRDGKREKREKERGRGRYDVHVRREIVL